MTLKFLALEVVSRVLERSICVGACAVNMFWGYPSGHGLSYVLEIRN